MLEPPGEEEEEEEPMPTLTAEEGQSFRLSRFPFLTNRVIYLPFTGYV